MPAGSALSCGREIAGSKLRSASKTIVSELDKYFVSTKYVCLVVVCPNYFIHLKHGANDKQTLFV